MFDEEASQAAHGPRDLRSVSSSRSCKHGRGHLDSTECSS